MAKYIYEYESWPHFTWDDEQVRLILSEVRHLQGQVLGRMDALGLSMKESTNLSILTMDVLKSSEIEGELLNTDQVRSSIARKLGLEVPGMVFPDRDVEGVVEMMMDATQKFDKSLSEDRLLGWHAALFPSGRSGLYKIDAGCYRKGIMQVVSGAMGRERVHYQAPPPETVRDEMDNFIDWCNEESHLDFVIKSALAHFWFVIIHPFDDGNGRIARAISDLFLARSEKSPQRFYSLSSQILTERKMYYATLQKVQHSDGDVTEWLVWYLNCLHRALENTLDTIGKVLHKAEFWERHKKTELNARQRLMLNRLLDGFTGKLKTSKWAKINKCSQDTALRDIKDLIDKGILKQESTGGRSTHYDWDDAWKSHA